MDIEHSERSFWLVYCGCWMRGRGDQRDRGPVRLSAALGLRTYEDELLCRELMAESHIVLEPLHVLAVSPYAVWVLYFQLAESVREKDRVLLV